MNRIAGRVIAGTLFSAFAVAAAQPVQAQAPAQTGLVYFCVVKDTASNTIYVSELFRAIKQARRFFYAEQYVAEIRRLYGVGQVGQGTGGCNQNDDDGGSAKTAADRARWASSTIYRPVFVNWRPREEPSPPQDDETVTLDKNGKIAALAIDRRSGERYGWAIDYDTLAAAEARATEECQKLGGSCHVVLRFTGGCGAYAVQQGSETLYGWGTNLDRNMAQQRAMQEVAQRGGASPVVRVWGCNSRRPTPPADAIRSSSAPGSDAGLAPTGPKSAGPLAGSASGPDQPAGKVSPEDEARQAERVRAEYEAMRAKAEAAQREEQERLDTYNRKVAEHEQQLAENQRQVATAADARRQFEEKQAQYERDRAAWEAEVKALKK